mgnify:FL=1
MDSEELDHVRSVIASYRCHHGRRPVFGPLQQRTDAVPAIQNPGLAGVFVFQSTKEVSVFEGQSKQTVDSKMASDSTFRQLYFHHQKLDKKVADAEHGILPIDDLTLTRMKREKLQAKDRLTRMLREASH